MQQIETDYLVIGSGAVGMAFVDVMLDETDADFVIVDRHHMPGGHWNDAYPFVRLHQPSAFYGVSSMQLGSGRIDEAGSNKGYFELASGAEVLAYYERVMRERFLASGRVRYFPLCDVIDDGRFRSLLSGEETNVTVAKRTVDGTFFNTSVPSTHRRKFTAAEGVACITPNDLPRRAAAHRRFTIVGAGKTAMDACVWLLENGADPQAISWIVPRDSWLMNRAQTQPSVAFFDDAIGGFAAQLEACAAASSVDDLFDRLEKSGAMLRIDPTRRPTMFHYATISEGEIEQLRRIETVLRQGRIEHIEPDAVLFVSGETASADPSTLYVDCTATAVEFAADSQPIFNGNRVTLQSLRSPLLPLSAAIAAYVEAHFENDEEKNRLCKPVVLADTPAQFMQSFVGNMANQYGWLQEPALNAWLAENRLDPFGKVVRAVDLSEPAKAEIMKRIQDNMTPAVANLQKLIAERSTTAAPPN